MLMGKSANDACECHGNKDCRYFSRLLKCRLFHLHKCFHFFLFTEEVKSSIETLRSCNEDFAASGKQERSRDSSYWLSFPLGHTTGCIRSF